MSVTLSNSPDQEIVNPSISSTIGGVADSPIASCSTFNTFLSRSTKVTVQYTVTVNVYSPSTIGSDIFSNGTPSTEKLVKL